MSEQKQNMLDGELYDPRDKTLVSLRLRARRIVENINNTPQSKHGPRKSQFESLFGTTGKGIHIESPFHCDYGENIHLGDRFFANMGCVILDSASVTIGADCKLGPQVGIYTATHPIDPEQRRSGLQYAKPITIGDNVWIGGHATLLPGVTLGNNVVVGAGAVVTKGFEEDNVILAGNPASIVKQID